MAAVFVQTLIVILFVIVAFICILVIAAALYISHVHRKYSHLPGPPYNRCCSISYSEYTDILNFRAWSKQCSLERVFLGFTQQRK